MKKLLISFLFIFACFSGGQIRSDLFKTALFDKIINFPNHIKNSMLKLSSDMFLRQLDSMGFVNYSPKLAQAFKATKGYLYTSALSYDGSQAAIGTYDTQIWDLKTESYTCKFIISHPGVVDPHSRVLAFSPDGSKLAGGMSRGYIEIWNPKTGASLYKLPIFKAKNSFAQPGDIENLAFSPDGSKLAVSITDTVVMIWDIANAKADYIDNYASARVKGDVTKYRVGTLTFSPDSSKVVLGCLSGIRVWDIKTKTCLHTLTGHTGKITSLAYSPDGSQLASGSYDNTVKIWDPKTEKLLHTLTGHGRYVWTVAYSPDGWKLASGSFDGTIKMWSPKTGRCLHTIDVKSAALGKDQFIDFVSAKGGYGGFVQLVSFNSDGSQLLSILTNGTIKIWNLVPSFTLPSEQENLLSKITQYVFGVHKKGDFKPFYLKSLEEIKTYNLFPEKLKKMLAPAVSTQPSFHASSAKKPSQSLSSKLATKLHNVMKDITKFKIF